MAGPWDVVKTEPASGSDPWAVVSVSPAVPSPSPQGLANQALRGTGIQVGPQPNPIKNIPVQGDNPVVRAAVAAGATLPSGPGQKPILGQGRSPLQVMSEQPLPFGSPSSAAEMVAEPARRIGSGDVAGGLGEIGGQAAQMYAIKKVGDVASAAFPKPAPTPGVKIPGVPSVEELTGTTPARIAELKSFPERVESVRQTAVSAEKAAHQAASNAFPKFDKPIETGRMIESPAQGPVEMTDFGEIAPTAKVPETTTFKALQEQRSNLLADIANEKRAVARGATPRFDLANMYEQLNGIDSIMNKAALDQGGPEGLAQLEAARAQFGKYMNDFHSQGSPIKGLLDAKPGETQKVISHLLSPDKGARAIETLGQYGVDTSQMQSLLGQGDRPLRVNTAESAKLRKAGSPDAYTIQRLRESISQSKFNEMPSSAQARLPAKAMSNTPPPLIRNIPVIGKKLTPRAVTTKLLENALRNKTGR